MGKKMLFKRLLSANFIGFAVHAQDGHRWIEFDRNRNYQSLHIDREMKRVNAGLFTSKVYGGLDEALDTIDELLKLINHCDLMTYYENYIFKEDIISNSGTNIKERVGYYD